MEKTAFEDNPRQRAAKPHTGRAPKEKSPAEFGEASSQVPCRADQRRDMRAGTVSLTLEASDWSFAALWPGATDFATSNFGRLLCVICGM